MKFIKMKYSFGASILVCALALCSCKSKGFSYDEHAGMKKVSGISRLNNTALMDTFKTVRSEQSNSNMRIVETLIIAEYDEKSGKPVKETYAKREFAQDSEKISSEIEEEGVNLHSKDTMNHIEETLEKADSEVKEEATGAQESFGKWIGIIIGIAVVSLVVYLFMKIKRINK